MTTFFKRLPKNTSTYLVTKNFLVNAIRNDSIKPETATHRVNKLEKKFLVWTGKYKTAEEVPAVVSQSVMERTRNRMRIKIANYMMVGTVIGCIIMVYLGKQDAKRGESIVKQNLDWHAQQNLEWEAQQKNK